MTVTAVTYALDVNRDPLRVLESTRLVLRTAQHVRIVPERIDSLAAALAQTTPPPADWAGDGHPLGANDLQRANLVLVVDALNFCFWSVPGGRAPRWAVTDGGQTFDGYWALVAALRRAVVAGRPLWDAESLATLSEADVAEILAGDPGTEQIPLLRARQQHLNELGEALLAYWGGSFLTAIEAAHHSAAALVREVLRTFPSFRDTAPWRGHDIRFYKRAQILVADLHAAFNGSGPGTFHDMEHLTAFADYKLPQLLRHHGVLDYAPALAHAVANYRLIPPESDEEIEIRAATIWAVELLRQALAGLGRPIPAYQIDWALWHTAQILPPETEPYHRTLTVFY